MKNYIIVSLVVCLAVLGSFFYKSSKFPVLEEFQIENIEMVQTSNEPPLFLYVFFSINNCNVCLEAIEVLNNLPSQFIVTGVVPRSELKNEKLFRKITKARFKLIAYSSLYKKFRPNYSPAIFGVSSKGKILFVLPGVPNEKEYLYNFLTNFYGKSIELLIPIT